MIPVAVLVAAAFLSLPFLLYDEPDGWSYTREIDRIGFPGGAIVVCENSQSPRDKAYITIRIEPNLASEENLAAYVESRTNALNALLKTVADDATIEAVIGFKQPMSPDAFVDFCQDFTEKPGDYAVIVTNKTTGKQSAEFFFEPRPQDADFTQNLTSTLEGYKLEGIIAFYCYIKADAARNLLSDSRVLLIDPWADPQVLEIKQTYESKGLYVQLEGPEFKETWEKYTNLRPT